jgi:Cu2+-exporting ATPase
MEHEHHHQGHSNDEHAVINQVQDDHKTPARPVDHSIHSKDHAVHRYNKHAGHHTENFLKRFRVCLVLTIPVLLLSEMIQHWLGFHFSFPGSSYVLFGFSTIIYFFGGWPFLKGMYNEIRFRAIGMMTLVAIAITVAYLYSTAIVFGLKGMDFFWELATLIDIMLLGHWLEMKSEMAASRALETLVELLPSNVHLEENGIARDIDIKDLKRNDIVLIKPGEKIPADGIVLEGHSQVNESMLTGESIPVEKSMGNTLIAGAVNGNGSLRVQVTGTGADSYLNKVINLVKSAQEGKSKTQNLADQVAKWLTIISIIAGLASFFYWYSEHGDLAFAMERLVTVMVTACPHALGVAIPLVVAISTTRAAVTGLLIRNRTAFERSGKLTTVLFDKTGTLTKGTHEVAGFSSLDANYSDKDILQFAAAVQQFSEHYIARGIMNKLELEKLALWKAGGFNYEQGIGVSALVGDKRVMVAGPNYFNQIKKSIPSITVTGEKASTIVYIIINDQVAGFIRLVDTIRPSAASAIKALKDMHVRSWLITGDNENIAASVANELKMEGYFANVLPHQKQEKINELKNKGEIVAMAGDGVNDAPALAAADVGIAIGSGTDVAAETADIILVNSDPLDVVRMIKFARLTYRKMIQNLFWAIGYNIAAIPLAAGLLYPRFVLSPAIGAILMGVSTIIVALNAQLLKRQL